MYHQVQTSSVLDGTTDLESLGPDPTTTSTKCQPERWAGGSMGRQQQPAPPSNLPSDKQSLHADGDVCNCFIRLSTRDGDPQQGRRDRTVPTKNGGLRSEGLSQGVILPHIRQAQDVTGNFAASPEMEAMGVDRCHGGRQREYCIEDRYCSSASGAN
jgi:hypothetical protein